MRVWYNTNRIVCKIDDIHKIFQATTYSASIFLIFSLKQKNKFNITLKHRFWL